MDNAIKNQEPQPGQNKIFNKNILLICSLLVLVVLTIIFIAQQNKIQAMKNDLNSTMQSLNQEKEQAKHNLLGYIKAVEKDKKYEWREWNVYYDPRLNLEIKIPSSIDTPPDFIISKALSKELDKYSGISITNHSGVNLQINKNKLQFTDLATGYPSFETTILNSTTTINGMEFGIYKNPTGYCDGPGCGSPYIDYVVINNKDNYYSLRFWGDTEMNEIETEILNSLKFTD